MSLPDFEHRSLRVRCKGWVCEHERKAAEYGLTLATLCDLVLGEDAQDRSDKALVRAVAKLVRASSQTDGTERHAGGNR